MDRSPLGGRRFTHIANVILLGTVTSTNSVARRVVERMMEDESDLLPTVFVAKEQTAGRGRADRVWVSPPGGLYLSLCLSWPEGPGRIRVPVEAGILVAEALGAILDAPVRLKWPNDLVIGGLKVGGILTEARAGTEGTGMAIVGIGLNLDETREELDDAGLPNATSVLLATGRRLDPEGALVALLDRLDAALEEGVFAPFDIPARFAAVTVHHLGDTLVVKDGDRVVSGSFEGVGQDGRLRLRTAGEVQAVFSGEIVSF